jgi:hypothetical protein
LYRHRRSPNRSKAWFEHHEGTLLRTEQALVQRDYPGLAFQIDSSSGRMHLIGAITLLSECGVATPISVRIAFPADYPHSEPTASDDAKRFPEEVDRHILKGGKFCLWLPPCSPWNPDDPERLLRFLDEVAVFLERQLVYDATGGRVWPGPQQQHGRAGYEEFMLSLLGGSETDLESLLPAILNRKSPGRNDPCPCRSSRKYKRCHADAVKEIARRIGRDQLAFVYRTLPGRTMPSNANTNEEKVA